MEVIEELIVFIIFLEIVVLVELEEVLIWGILFFEDERFDVIFFKFF